MDKIYNYPTKQAKYFEKADAPDEGIITKNWGSFHALTIHEALYLSLGVNPDTVHLFWNDDGVNKNDLYLISFSGSSIEKIRIYLEKSRNEKTPALIRWEKNEKISFIIWGSEKEDNEWNYIQLKNNENINFEDIGRLPFTDSVIKIKRKDIKIPVLIDTLNKYHVSTNWQNENVRVCADRITDIKRATYANVIRRVDPSSEINENTLVYAVDVERYFNGAHGKSELKTILSDSERMTLLKILLGMAIDMYNFDPRAPRNLATGGNKGSIRYALQKISSELDVSEDTIRGYLAEACEFITKDRINLPVKA